MNPNNELPLSPATASPARSKAEHSAATDELSQAKRELLQAEMRLAKARATAAGAEIDVKVLGARLKALAK